MRYDPTTTTPAKGAAGDIAKGSMELKSERNVNVRTYASVVTLSGQVPTFGAGAQDSEMARGFSGVKSVQSQLSFTK